MIPSGPSHQSGRKNGRTRKWAWATLAAVCALHVVLVVSIARQPLRVNRTEMRAITWPLFNDAVHRPGPAADLFAVYHAGHQLHTGRSPYGMEEEPRRTPYLFPFRYLPIVGQTLGRALVPLPPRTAWWLWIAVLEVALFALMVRVWKYTASTRIAVFAVTALALSTPYFLELHMGQFTFLATLLLAAPLLQAGKSGAGGRRILASSGYVLSVMLKIFPLVAAPALLKDRGRWPMLASAVLVTVGVSLPYFLAHPADWKSFFDANFAAPQGGLDSGNFGFAYLVYMLSRALGFHAAASNWATIASCSHLILIGFTAIFVFFSRERSVLFGVAAMLLAHFLSYLHVWEHHMSAVVLIAVLLLAAVSRISHRRTTLALLILGTLLLVLPTPFVWFDTIKDPRVWDPTATWSLPKLPLMVASKALPVLLLYGVCLTLLGRAGFGRPWRPSASTGCPPDRSSRSPAA